MTEQSQRAGYRPELDGLRTLAVGGVLLFHAAFRFRFRLLGGQYGVDLFFVLSGLLITTLLIQEHRRSGRIDLRSFYFRRVLRLIPALLLLLVVAAVVMRHVSAIQGSMPLWQASLVAFFGIGNWFQTSPSRLGILTHTWSLAIEWQFYLVWPAVLVACLKRGTSLRRLSMYVGSAAVVAAALRALVFHTVGVPQAVFWTITRCDGVLLGSALALAIADGSRIVSVLRRNLVSFPAAALAGFLVASLGVATTWVLNGGLFVLVCCFALVIGHVTVDADGLMARALRVPPLPQIGRISYGIYLFHLPVYTYVFRSPGHRGVKWVAVAALLSVAVAVVSYFVIERPALRIRSALRDRRARVAAGATSPASDPNHPRPASRRAE